jgi:hypothetical protein
MKQNTKIIGITGLARHGKDTAGRYIAEQLDYDIYSFAAPIKKITAALLGWDEHETFEHSKEVAIPANITAKTITRALAVAVEYGLTDYAKSVGSGVDMLELLDILGVSSGDCISPRQAWQLAGTEWGRLRIHEDVWVSLAPTTGIVICDVRFDSEADYLRSVGCQIIHVHNPRVTGEAGVASHASEAGVSKLPEDLVLVNDSTIVNLQLKCLELLRVINNVD